MTKRKNSSAAEPNPFRVSASYEQGVNGYVLNVQVYERVEGTDHIGLSGGFVFDLECLPALQGELSRVLRKAKSERKFRYSTAVLVRP